MEGFSRLSARAFVLLKHKMLHSLCPVKVRAGEVKFVNAFRKRTEGLVLKVYPSPNGHRLVKNRHPFTALPKNPFGVTEMCDVGDNIDNDRVKTIYAAPKLRDSGIRKLKGAIHERFYFA